MNGYKHGLGTESRVGGDTYQGRFEFGVRHGPGYLKEAKDNESFIGTWVQGKVQGACRHIDSNGVSQLLIMKDGVSVSKGSKDFPAFLMRAAVCQMIMYAWCYLVFPVLLLTGSLGHESKPACFFVGVFAFCFACICAK